MRSFIPFLLLGSFADEGQPPGGRCAALIKEYEAAELAAIRAYTAARSDDERRAADRKMPKVEAYAPRFLELARSEAGSPAAFDPLLWVCSHCKPGPDLAEAIETLRRDHIEDPRLGLVCQAIRPKQLDSIDRLLAEAIERSPHHAVQGEARYGLANRLKREAELLRETDMPEAVRIAMQACGLYEQVADRYADVKHFPGTLGDAVRLEYFELRFAEGMPAPEVEGVDLDGLPMRLSDDRGKVVVLSFWGFWCGPCRSLFPHERELVRRLEGRPFALLGINSDFRGELTAARQKEDITWRSWWDGGGSRGPIARRWGITAWPTIYVLDHRGVIRFAGVRGAALDEAVDRLLAELKEDVSMKPPAIDERSGRPGFGRDTEAEPGTP